MKKVLFFLSVVLMSLTLSAQVSEEVKKLPAKGVDKVDKILDGTRTDAKDAISTLHQDATAVISTAYNDAKSLLGTAYEDVTSIVKYATPKLEAGLVALAQTLKTTVAEVFEALVMKHVAISVSYALIGFFAFLFMFFTYRILAMPREKLYSDTPNEYGKYLWKPQWAISLGLCSVVTIGLFINFMSNFQTMVVGFIAPKALALQDVFAMVNTLFN